MGPASSGGSGSGSGSASVFLPPNQGAAAGMYGDLLTPLAGLSANAGAGTPAGQNYPSAMNLIEQFLTGSTTGGAMTPFNQFSGEALTGANAAAGYAPNLFNQGTAGASGLYGAASTGLPYASQALTQGFSPAYGSIVDSLEGNPFAKTALNGALQGANFGQMGGDQLYGLTQQTVGSAFNPLYGNLVNDALTNPYYSGALAGAQAGAGYGQAGAASMANAGQQLLSTGFDPQSALFNRTQAQQLDQSNVANAMAGVAGTPYGASVTSNALGNFDINWQNSQLARQAQAAGAAAPLLQAAPGLAAGSAALPTEALYRQIQGIEQPLAAQLGAYGSGLGAASAGLGAAANLPIQSSQAPTNAFQAQLNSVLGGLNAQQRAALLGSSAYGNLLGSTGSGLSGAQNLGYGSATGSAALSGLPYNTGAGIGNNALSSLTSLTNLGNNQYALPQQVLSDIMQYMGLGQSASQISGALGQMGVNQLGSAIGGIGSLAGGANSLFGGGGSGGALSGLFGRGGGSAAFDAIANGGLTDFGGGGAALGVADAVAPATIDYGALASAAPFALSA